MKPANNRRNSLLKILLWPFKSYLRILAVVIFIGFYQYQSIQIDILAREIRSLELKQSQLVNGNNTLQVQIDQLTHINRIEKIAHEKFGLVAGGESIEKLVIEPYSPQKEKEQEQQTEKIKLAGIH
jgi:cell division protein FtsB